MGFLIEVIIICGFVLFICLALAISERLLEQNKESEVIINKTRHLKAKCGEKLLNALSDCNVHLPVACGGKGSCGHCKIKAYSGAGRVNSIEKLFLKAEEIEAGLRLACQVKVRGNMELEVSNELLKAQSFRAKLIDSKNVAYNIKVLTFSVEEGKKLDFKAGQYVQAVYNLHWEKAIRAYSISSSPGLGNDRFSIDVQLVENGVVSSYLHSIEPGSILDFTGPFGDMRPIVANNMILIAGGIGLAPMRAILSDLIEQGGFERIILFHGVKEKKYLYCQEEYAALQKSQEKFVYQPVLSAPRKEDCWNGEVGLVTEVLERFLESAKEISPNDYNAYICGPSEMTLATKALLLKNGLSEKNIYLDSL